MVFGLRLSALAEQPESAREMAAIDPLWRASVGRILESLKLLPRNIARITWAAVDAKSWQDRAVVLLELEKGQDAKALAGLGDAFDLQVAGQPCRCMANAAWPHPFVALDERTVITGPEPLLRELADRAEPPPESAVVGRLLKGAMPEPDFFVLIDLAAAREAQWPLPISVWDLWSAGRDPWHVLWETPLGLGVWVRRTAPGRSEVGWVCEGETAALKVRAALDQLLPAARTALDGTVAALTKRLESGRITAQEADQYDFLLKRTRAALETAKAEVVDQSVWLRIDWEQHLPAAAAAGLDSRQAIRTDWLEAARRADEANHGRIVASLLGLVKAEGHFPAGAGGATLLPPETRLSWIAAMLPYFEHRDWHRELQFGYSWNSAQNRPVTQRRLDTVVNPALGPGSTEAGFPVTHYVGVAGVGADAAELKPGDPRAGLFGYARNAGPADIADGASNTLATLGVSGRLGPWASGGEATVRGLTRRPYVNGPDGFGSGQPDGMLAGMADGSVRFISKDVDPTVLEQLATMRGGEKASVAVLEPKPAAPPKAASPPAKQEPSPPAAVAKTAAPPPPAGKEARAEEEEDAEESATFAGEELLKIDLQARLADRVPEIHIPGTPLLEAVRFMSQMSTVPVSFDLDWMRALGVGLRDPVTVRLAGATSGEILQALAAARGLACEVTGDMILVTAPAKRRGALQTVKYAVADLTGKDPVSEGQLREWIGTLVAPESWREAGGPGTIELAGGDMAVTQTELVHFHVRDFCDRLRLARGLSPEARPGTFKPTLATRFDEARAKLRQPVTANFAEPTPLAEIAAELERLTKATVLFDLAALAQARVSPQRRGTLSAQDQPFSEVLAGLLRTCDLTYRIAGAETFEITSRQAVAARLEVEFYRVASLLAQGRAPEALIEQIKAQVASATWNDAGGPGTMCFDKASGHLIVLQSQPVQVRLQLLLARLAADQE